MGIPLLFGEQLALFEDVFEVKELASDKVEALGEQSGDSVCFEVAEVAVESAVVFDIESLSETEFVQFESAASDDADESEAFLMKVD